ncbi:2-oxoacid:acceptor oxidoreductase subunit alpha [Paradesulfitobacterium ferrireducens]|uniref:2-oxoacid:acceptor oxidoreductase subunit alpha n=1 Tax=Paradesulfitobacterium ferrireducens TaxID=2816476 RepID=UPI001A8EEB89|nr:2-oxoacid:acceptor oxidoreductase subunit alpha [Paradesulfitobacterium ferrireducens]
MRELAEVRLMQGNEACVQAALDAGVRFFGGYPITPSTEIAEGMAEKLPALGGKFIQMEDEIASIASIIGASLAGVKSMTATSGPGFSLMQENLGYACMTEVPCVIVNVQRGGPSTGRPTAPAQGDVMQARWGTHGDHPAIVLSPWSAQETYTLTVKAVNLSERFRTPVILLMDEVVAHLREGVRMPDPRQLKLIERPRPQGGRENYRPFGGALDEVPAVADFGMGYRCNVTGLVHDDVGHPSGSPQVTNDLIRRLSGKVEAHRDEIIDYELTQTGDADMVIFAYGSTARTSLRALKLARAQGLKVGMIRPTTLWPFPEKAIEEVAERGIPILVPEMNLGQLVLEVERIAKGRSLVQPLSRVDGELFNPDEILEAVKELKPVKSRKSSKKEGI